MEGENGIPAPPPSPASGSRWNPTKEQISLLEGLYKEGMRTPTAEQIQHITGRLKKYGRIEGKNVFYWFQNHKARQRQKQKQESFGYFARFLRNRAGPPVLYPAPPPPALLPVTPACAAVNVVRAPFCMPQYAGAIGFYSPFQRVFLTGAAHLGPEGVLQMVETEAYGTPEGPNNPHRQLYDDDCTSAPTDERGACMGDDAPHETLQLFPLHPTGILQDKSACSVCSVSDDSAESLDEEESGVPDKHPPFDFFGSSGKCSS